MSTIDYDIIGTNDDDSEWCAGASKLEEAISYAIQYLEDYEKVEIYKVTREKITEYS